MIKDGFGEVNLQHGDPNSYLKSLASLCRGTTSSMAINGAGVAWNEDGNSNGIGNQLDKSLFVALRRQSKAVVTSARTFNAERYNLPSRATLVVVGEVTRPDSDRLKDGQNRLVLVGSAGKELAISGSKWIPALEQEPNQLRQSLGLDLIDRLNFEFGPAGTSRNSRMINFFLCTSEELVTARAFVDSCLVGFELRFHLKLDTQFLSVWQRRVAKP